MTHMYCETHNKLSNTRGSPLGSMGEIISSRCPEQPGTAVETLPWTNRFMSANTTIDSSSSQSHVVDPDWIHILRKQRLPCVKGKVTVYVTCQCSENRCFWRVIDHKYQGPCCVAWCTVLTASYNLQHITLFHSI